MRQAYGFEGNARLANNAGRPDALESTGVAVQAVIFDWGGTLTPWHDVDQEALWRAVCSAHYPAERVAEIAAAAATAEEHLWQLGRQENRSATLDQVFTQAGVTPTEALLASYYEAWEPHTFTHPDAVIVLRQLRERGIKVGVLSNTMWPRARHELIFSRDSVLDLIDGAVYSSEIPWVKPHKEAFRAAMAAIGADDPGACVYVGDRPFDDVHGAQAAGMRAVLVPHSSVPAFPGTVPDGVISRLADLTALIDTW
jgi:putative hydrolase of the HAD superfamily